MFGGQAPTSEERKEMSDTWIYAPHLNSWVEIKGDVRPGGCMTGALWYDEANDRMIHLRAGRYKKTETWSLKITPSY
jgi:hypothetical protein